MERTRNFHEKLEADVRRLMVGMREQNTLPVKENISHREVLKESLKTYAEEIVPAASPVSVSCGKNSSSENIFPDYASGGAVPASVKIEVERLIDVVFEHSLDAGIRESKKHSPFVQDVFHDTLTDKLLPELEKRGIIK